jgi:protein tyrosine/serine phosphatase
MSDVAEIDLSTPRGRLAAHLDMLFVDHGILRLLWTARHPVTAEMYRANQPSPFQLARAKKLGIRTIVNLRGARPCGSYALEKEACRHLGLKLENFPVNSRDAPRKEIIHGAESLFGRIAYPALMHCKSGADRAGFMSVLYLMLEKNAPVERALAHLSWRYGHVRQAKTGILDFFFESYQAANRNSPVPFMRWVDEIYDPTELKAHFMSKWWANTLVDRVLKRE